MSTYIMSLRLTAAIAHLLEHRASDRNIPALDSILELAMRRCVLEKDILRMVSIGS